MEGDIFEVLERARQLSGEGDIYIDGGDLIRQALQAGLVDEMIVTIAPVILGRGFPLFAGVEGQRPIEFLEIHRHNHRNVQIVARPLAE